MSENRATFANLGVESENRREKLRKAARQWVSLE